MNFVRPKSAQRALRSFHFKKSDIIQANFNLFFVSYISQLHNRCVSGAGGACTLGRHARHILPPTAIRPLVLDRQRSLPHRPPHDQV